MKELLDAVSILDDLVGLHENIEVIYTVYAPTYRASLRTCDGAYETLSGEGDTVLEALADLARKAMQR